MPINYKTSTPSDLSSPRTRRLYSDSARRSFKDCNSHVSCILGFHGSEICDCREQSDARHDGRDARHGHGDQVDAELDCLAHDHRPGARSVETTGEHSARTVARQTTQSDSRHEDTTGEATDGAQREGVVDLLAELDNRCRIAQIGGETGVRRVQDDGDTATCVHKVRCGDPFLVHCSPTTSEICKEGR